MQAYLKSAGIERVIHTEESNHAPGSESNPAPGTESNPAPDTKTTETTKAEEVAAPTQDEELKVKDPKVQGGSKDEPTSSAPTKVAAPTPKVEDKSVRSTRRSLLSPSNPQVSEALDKTPAVNGGLDSDVKTHKPVKREFRKLEIIKPRATKLDTGKQEPTEPVVIKPEVDKPEVVSSMDDELEATEEEMKEVLQTLMERKKGKFTTDNTEVSYCCVSVSMSVSMSMSMSMSMSVSVSVSVSMSFLNSLGFCNNKNNFLPVLRLDGGRYPRP